MGDKEAATSSIQSEFNPDVNQDELIMQRCREIEKEICDTTSLVGEKEDLSLLEAEYVSDEVYQAKVKDLLQKYRYIRRTRPDGNCFYRAFAYAYFERLLYYPLEYASFRELIMKNKSSLMSSGFSPVTLEDFHETFMEVVDVLAKGSSAQEELFKLFNEQGYSDYVVVYLRLITSSELQRDAEFYSNFIEGDRTIPEFCHQEVEPMYKEIDEIHIVALSTALNVGIRVRYMDRGQSTEAIAHDFPHGSQICVHLLYRPGHYDILYPVEAN